MVCRMRDRGTDSTSGPDEAVGGAAGPGVGWGRGRLGWCLSLFFFEMRPPGPRPGGGPSGGGSPGAFSRPGGELSTGWGPGGGPAGGGGGGARPAPAATGAG